MWVNLLYLVLVQPPLAGAWVVDLTDHAVVSVAEPVA